LTFLCWRVIKNNQSINQSIRSRVVGGPCVIWVCDIRIKAVDWSCRVRYICTVYLVLSGIAIQKEVLSLKVEEVYWLGACHVDKLGYTSPFWCWWLPFQVCVARPAKLYQSFRPSGVDEYLSYNSTLSWLEMCTSWFFYIHNFEFCYFLFGKCVYYYVPFETFVCVRSHFTVSYCVYIQVVMCHGLISLSHIVFILQSILIYVSWSHITVSYCVFLQAKTCYYGMHYTECTSKQIRTCNSLYSALSYNASAVVDSYHSDCFPGCECPPGKFLHNAVCVEVSQCPCQYHGLEYEPGQTVKIDCNHWYEVLKRADSCSHYEKVI